MADMTLEELRTWIVGSNDFDCMHQRAKACVTDAIKQREQGAKDAARLDWLGSHPRLASIVIDGNATDCYLYGVSGAMGLKLREILDIAMAMESGNG